MCTVSEGRRDGEAIITVFVYAKDPQTISVGRQTHMDYRRQQWQLRCFTSEMNSFINYISLIPWQLHICLKNQPLPQAPTALTNTQIFVSTIVLRHTFAYLKTPIGEGAQTKA